MIRRRLHYIKNFSGAKIALLLIGLGSTLIFGILGLGPIDLIERIVVHEEMDPARKLFNNFGHLIFYISAVLLQVKTIPEIFYNLPVIERIRQRESLRLFKEVIKWIVLYVMIYLLLQIAVFLPFMNQDSIKLLIYTFTGIALSLLVYSFILLIVTRFIPEPGSFIIVLILLTINLYLESPYLISVTSHQSEWLKINMGLNTAYLIVLIGISYILYKKTEILGRE
ncbi:MAG: hypothetical protein Q4P28_02840 [Tissierellia bacterium]|nr:hypothetical protein [Tissierellia bacterium]